MKITWEGTEDRGQPTQLIYLYLSPIYLPVYRLVALIATFGGFKPKKTFRFIASCCPNYVTGQFLARLQESGRQVGR